MRTLFACMAICLIVSALPASAATYEIDAPTSLWDLDHGKHAVWGVNWVLPQGEVIVSARIKFYDLYNWDKNDTANVMYVHLLDSATVGVSKPNDSKSGDQFAGQGVDLGSYHDPDGPNNKEDKSFYVPATSFALLEDGNFGFGVDPDCHFYNCGVKIKITTKCGETTVPEPASLGAMCCGLSGMLGFVWRRRRS